MCWRIFLWLMNFNQSSHIKCRQYSISHHAALSESFPWAFLQVRPDYLTCDSTLLPFKSFSCLASSALNYELLAGINKIQKTISVLHSSATLWQSNDSDCQQVVMAKLKQMVQLFSQPHNQNKSKVTLWPYSTS